MPSIILPSFWSTRKTTAHARSALVAISAFLLAVSASMGSAAVAFGQDYSATTTPDLSPLAESWEAGGTVSHLPWVWQPAIDPLTSDIWVAAPYEDQYWMIAPDGTFLEAWGTSGSEPGQFKLTDNRPSSAGFGSLTFAPDGSFYVADTGNYRIQHFDHDRNLLTSWGSFGTDDGQFAIPLSIATDGTMVYVSDTGRQDIQVFDAAGTYQRTIADVGPGWGGGWIALAPGGRLAVTDVSPVDGNPMATDQGGGISIVNSDRRDHRVAFLDRPEGLAARDRRRCGRRHLRQCLHADDRPRRPSGAGRAGPRGEHGRHVVDRGRDRRGQPGWVHALSGLRLARVEGVRSTRQSFLTRERGPAGPGHKNG